MSAVATEPVRTEVAPVVGRPTARLFEPPGGAPSLEDAILRICDELDRQGESSCPVCGDGLRAGGDCSGCGSALS